MSSTAATMTTIAIATEPLHCLLRGVRPAVLGRALLTSLLCSICFPTLILVLAWHSMGLKEMGVVAATPIMLALASAYALFGLHFGFVSPLLNSIIAEVPGFEQSLRPITEPVLRRVFDFLPTNVSIELPDFKRKVDDSIAACFMTEDAGVMGAPLRLAYRFIFRKSIESFRDALLHDLDHELRASGETRVTADLLRTHASRHVAALAAEKLQSRLETLRTIHLDITLLIFALPLGVAIYRLA